MQNQIKKLSYFVFLLLLGQALSAQEFVFGDALPDAPELSQRGDHHIGVKTLNLVHKQQPDILNADKGIAPLYDRKLTVEVWYPADLAAEGSVTYEEVLGMSSDPKRPLIPFTFKGRASRDAAVKQGDEKFPLVVVSHGYVGSRYLMTYLTENLASKGYIVVAIDHAESTFRDAANFTSTLINRSPDIRFVLNSMIGTSENTSFLKGQVDADNIAIMGYSMGGYGVLNLAGASYNPAFEKGFQQFSAGSELLGPLVHGNPALQAPPKGIKAVVAMAPWGQERFVWSAESMKELKIPTMFIAGSMDDISGYEKGIKAIYEGVTNTERYLLTYANARHNIAPNPPPAEALVAGRHIDEYYRYAEPSWDQRKINNINQHFITAFLDMKLKGKDTSKYFVIPEDGKEPEGFVKRSFTGLSLDMEKPE